MTGPVFAAVAALVLVAPVAVMALIVGRAAVGAPPACAALPTNTEPVPGRDPGTGPHQPSGVLLGSTPAS